MSADVRAWLDQLEAAHAAATPGPWTATSGRADAGAYLDAPRPPEGDGPPWVGRTTVAADAACIVADHDAVPRLVAAVRAALDLHVSDGDPADPECATCPDNWPCETYRQLTAPLTAEDGTR